MTQVSELKPCRFCGGECAVEVFSASANAEPANATLWMCCNNQLLGGSCPHQIAYLYEHSWQDAMKAAEPAGDVERDEALPPIMLQIAAASREQEMWERRFHVLYHSHPSWRSADNDGPWGLRDFLRYAGEVCGFGDPLARTALGGE